MPRYRKKPVEVDAIQWTTENVGDILAFIEDAGYTCSVIGKYIYINTLEGKMRADPDDFIIKGVEGEIYPCKPGIFEKTYDLVE